jgi:CYTH domain-containing protein
MVIERRFLVASSLARLIQRESVATTRICEGHFAPQGGRRQLVRVERERAVLVLVNREEGAAATEEQAEVPHSHAEALIDVAAGAIAFDRMPIRIGHDVEAVLDRYVVPQGVDILTVTIRSDPRAFVPPLWAGTEITDEAAFEPAALAVDGVPGVPEVEISNMALESLLDTLEGRGSYRFRPRPSPAPAESAFAAARARPIEAPAPAPVEAPRAETPAEPLAEAPAPEAAPAAAEPVAPSTVVEITPVHREGDGEGQRRPMLRNANTVEIDEEIARLARTLAPRTQRS